MAGHRGDDRLAPLRYAVPAAEEVFEIGAGEAQLGHFLDIGAGGEGLGRAGDQHAADGLVALEAVEHLVELVDELGIDGVERLGAVQGDQADSAGLLHQQGLVGHGRFLANEWAGLWPA
ncbi:hypothetical protein D3C78_1293100 [compost metagenome]